MAAINPLFCDLSHHDPVGDYAKVKAAGIFGVVFKATEGATYTDPLYVRQQRAAKEAGLLWGSYHFANSAPVNDQIDNYLKFASPDPDELFCLDWEDNAGNKMSLANVKAWIEAVEAELKRPGECVIYSGNTVKDACGNTVDTFLGARRLWLAQYSATPVCQKSWKTYWAWQFTDGQIGPQPHSIPGIGPCDINSYDGTAAQLAAEWATGKAVQPPAKPPEVAVAPPQVMPPVVAVRPEVEVIVIAPPGVTVTVRQVASIADLAPPEPPVIEPPAVEPPAPAAWWQTGIETTVFGGADDRNRSAYPPYDWIGDQVLGVALPAQFFGLRPKVLVRNAANGKTVTAEIIDIGPWMIDDDYWTKGAGVRPVAETCFRTRKPLPSGPNAGKVPTNAAGLDLTPAAAKAIDLKGKGACDWSLILEGVPVA